MHDYRAFLPGVGPEIEATQQDYDSRKKKAEEKNWLGIIGTGVTVVLLVSATEVTFGASDEVSAEVVETEAQSAVSGFASVVKTVSTTVESFGVSSEQALNLAKSFSSNYVFNLVAQAAGSVVFSPDHRIHLNFRDAGIYSAAAMVGAPLFARLESVVPEAISPMVAKTVLGAASGTATDAVSQELSKGASTLRN